MKDTHCSYCGATFSENQKNYPKQCVTCDEITWRNPLPVSVVLVPIENYGVLVGRRGISPGKGEFGLPGGYIEYGESWQTAGARELKEEIDLDVKSSALRLFDVFSSEEHLLVFSIAPTQSIQIVKDFKSNAETTEVIVAHKPIDLAFYSHTLMLQRFLNTKN